jgi:hypothetical protein
MTTKYIPEVGEKCMYSFSNTVWEGAEVKAISGNEVWLKDKSGDAIVDIRRYYFRPIKSQADIEREEAIERMADVIGVTLTGARPSMMAKLYDAGYHNGPKVGDEVNKKLIQDRLYYEFGVMASMHDATQVITDNFKIYPRGDV